MKDQKGTCNKFYKDRLRTTVTPATIKHVLSGRTIGIRVLCKFYSVAGARISNQQCRDRTGSCIPQIKSAGATGQGRPVRRIVDQINLVPWGHVQLDYTIAINEHLSPHPAPVL